MNILSILIPITESRRKIFQPLHDKIIRQCEGKPVEVLLNWNESESVGKKRNDLCQLATGSYSVHIDSDDDIPDDYIDRVLEALKTSPDCVGISGVITTNGINRKQWHISKEYGSWFQKSGVYYRTPNHISPVKTSIAQQVGFPDIKSGEDHAYSIGILPLLKTEVIIKGNMYHYKYNSRK